MNGKLTPRSYYLHVPGGKAAMLMLAAVVSVIVAGAGGYVFFYTWHPAFLILLLFAAGFWCVVLCTPYCIDVRADQMIEVVSLLRRRSIAPADIQTITSNQRGLTITCRSGSVNLRSHAFTDSHTLLTELQSANPKIEFVGC